MNKNTTRVLAVAVLTGGFTIFGATAANAIDLPDLGGTGSGGLLGNGMVPMWIAVGYVGGTVILGVVLGALVTPLLPAPSNGGPLGVPLAPAAPSGSNGSSSVAFYGELNSGVPAGIGAFGTVGADVDDLPSSPTFASDTTPD